MKKILAIFLTVCMLTSGLCFAVSADEATTDTVVMRVTALTKDGKVFTPEKSEFTNSIDGWVAAATYAKNSTWKNDNNIDRVVVDLLADWTATNNSFGSGEGISSDGSICVPKNTRITINMNGHTISRAMSGWDYNGEVIWVREGVDLIINGGKSGDAIVDLGKNSDTAKTGTITGGNSGNGAGGIHIDEKARVTLNNVNIVGNIADDDNGAGLAIHNNSVLTMNGGSFQDNVTDAKEYVGYYGVGAYIYKATAVFNNVLFKNNQCTKSESEGSAIFSWNSDVTIHECTFDGNGIKDEKKGYIAAESLIEARENSIITVKKSTFTGNGDLYLEEMSFDNFDYSTLFAISGSTLTIEEDCTFTNNTVIAIFQTLSSSKLSITDATFKDNAASVLYSKKHSADSYFKECTFSNNFPDKKIRATANTFHIENETFTFNKCDLGDSTFTSSKNVVLKDTEAPKGYPEGSASIFGEGSLPMIISLAALIVAGTSIILCAYIKKRLIPATANNATEAEGGE